MKGDRDAGTDETSGSLFSYVALEDRIPSKHPLRRIRQVVNEALTSLNADFEGLYVHFGRPSITPERLIRASLLQILFSICRERQLMKQMNYNLLFRWTAAAMLHGQGNSGAAIARQLRVSDVSVRRWLKEWKE